MSRISTMKFLFYQGLSCAAWSVAITALGYYFGAAVEAVLGKAANVEKIALIVIVGVAAAMWGYHRWKEKRGGAES